VVCADWEALSTSAVSFMGLTYAMNVQVTGPPS
jgi:hypothetical protein